MRTVYVDVLMTVNLFIDFILIVCTKQFLHIRAGLCRMILGSVLGGILSLAALLPRIPIGLNIVLDFVFAAAIIFTAFGKTDVRQFIKRTAVYFSFSFSFCGIMIFVYTSFRPKGMEIYNDVIYFNISPILLIILTLVCYYVTRLFRRLTQGEVHRQVCNVEIFFGSSRAAFCALIDTGCEVKEPFSGLPVIIAERSCFETNPLEDNKFRLIPYSSLGGKGILKGFRPARVTIDGKEIANDLYVGLCEDVLKGDIKSVVPYEIIKQT